MTIMIIRKEISERWLAWGSSPVDWCEENYAVTMNIAEFTNTFSNIFFVLIPAFCIGTKIWSSFNKHVSFGAFLQFFFLIFIGFASAYFHATLSLMGQFLDEVGIIWSVSFGYASFMPDRMRPKFFHGVWAYVIATIMAISMTGAWFISPQLNPFCLMALTVPVIVAQIQELTTYGKKDTYWISLMALIFTGSAITAWVADKVMCGMWKSFRIPGLHNIWHILMALGAYFAILQFSYMKAINKSPKLKASIRYLPEKMAWGLPYVYCKYEYS